MSNVNVSRAVENIRANTTVYTAIVEVVVNAIDAIEAKGISDGKVLIRAHRSAQLETDGNLPEVTGFEIEDNGVGFTEEHRDSFDTLYSDLKIKDGGKGFGRFVCLKYFDRFQVESDYFDGKSYSHRSFRMGKGKAIIVDESVAPSNVSHSKTIVHLDWLKSGKSLEKRLDTVARILVEKLLPYFITEGYSCPRIILSEADGSDTIVLNDFVSNQISSVIQEIRLATKSFDLKSGEIQEHFSVRLFKIFYPRNLKSRISLVAHKREVSSSLLHTYVPEFVEEFYEKTPAGNGSSARNYIVKAYVFSPFLDQHVSLERGAFDLESGGELLYGIGQADIDQSTAEIAKEALGSEIRLRQQKKIEDVQSYVDNDAPWHKTILPSLDLTNMPYNPSPEDIELRLQKEKFRKELQIKKDVTQVLSGGKLDNLRANVTRLVEAISESNKNNLVQYVAMRRNVLNIFGKSLEVDETGSYHSEGLGSVDIHRERRTEAAR